MDPELRFYTLPHFPLSSLLPTPLFFVLFFASVVLLIISHVILFLLLSSYFRTIYTKHKKLPQQVKNHYILF